MQAPLSVIHVTIRWGVSQREATPPTGNTAEANWLCVHMGKQGKERKRKDENGQTERKTRHAAYHSCGAIQAEPRQQFSTIKTTQFCCPVAWRVCETPEQQWETQKMAEKHEI